MNIVNLIGRLTKDPELRYTQSHMAFCSFTLAVNKNLTREKREELEEHNRPTADFPRITVRGKQAENASKYLRKGSQCAVEGRIQTGSYVDSNGKRIFTTDIVADTITYLDSRNNSQNNAGAIENQNRSNYTANTYKSNTGQNNAYFDDGFEEVQDDQRIPF